MYGGALYLAFVLQKGQPAVMLVKYDTALVRKGR